MSNVMKHGIWVFLLMMAGCAVSTENTVVTRPPVTTGKMHQASPAAGTLPTTVAILPFTNSTKNRFAYEVVRRTMANHFATRNYHWMHWRDVDRRLELAGLDSGKKVDAASPHELAQILGVDGLIYGNVTHYNKFYAGIYSRISVGVDLKFVNADGKVLWQAEDVKTSHAGGISTTPVGLLINALVAANHLRGDINLYRVADDLGRELAAKLPEPPVLATRKKPVITNVVHSGVGQVLRYGDTLDIGLEGDPHMTAAAVIQGLGVVDLMEKSPGQYIGHVNIGKNLNLDNVVVTGRLEDKYGATSSWISPYGLLNVDNTPPGKVTKLTAESADGAVHLAWQAPPDNDVAGYRIAIANTETGPATQTFKAANSSYTIDHLTNFTPVYVSVWARDRAGNQGEPSRIEATAAPDTRYAGAETMPSDLPPVIRGVWKLTDANSPYYLRADTRIATDGTLLVAPGVAIRVSPRAKLSVLGELHIFGSAAKPVVVSGDGGSFDAFVVLQGTLPVSIKGLDIVGAGIPVEIDAGAPLLADSTLADSQFNAITISGAARPVIENCVISGAKASGVIIQGQSQPTFKGDRFIKNQPFHVQNGSTYQVNLSGNTFDPPASSTTVLGNVSY